MLVLVVCRQPQKEETGVHSKVRPPALFPPRESSAPPRQMSHVHRVAHCTFIHHCKTSNQPHYFESTAVVTEAEFVSQGKCWATFHLNRAFVKHPRNSHFILYPSLPFLIDESCREAFTGPHLPAAGDSLLFPLMQRRYRGVCFLLFASFVADSLCPRIATVASADIYSSAIQQP